MIDFEHATIIYKGRKTATQSNDSVVTIRRNTHNITVATQLKHLGNPNLVFWYRNEDTIFISSKGPDVCLGYQVTRNTTALPASVRNEIFENLGDTAYMAAIKFHYDNEHKVVYFDMKEDITPVGGKHNETRKR